MVQPSTPQVMNVFAAPAASAAKMTTATLQNPFAPQSQIQIGSPIARSKLTKQKIQKDAHVALPYASQQ